MALGQNQTLATLVGGKRSHHCAIPAPHIYQSQFKHPNGEGH